MQLEAKRKMLESPKAQWASQEAYEAAYTSYLRAGGAPISHPAGVIPGSTPEERRAEAAAYDAREASPQAQQPVLQAQQGMLRNPFTGQMLYDVRPDPYAGVQGIPGEEWLASRRQQQQQQQQDPMRNIRRAAPVTAGLYEISAALTKQIQSGFAGVIGYSPTAHPGIRVLFGASTLVTSLPQMAGMGLVVGEFAVRNPARVPEAVVVGLPLMAAELTKQVQTSPFETAGMVAGMIVGGKALKIVSAKMPAVKIRGLEIPKGAGVAEEIKIPITQWKPSPANPKWTPGKGWSGGIEEIKIPITQWKPSPSNPVWTHSKGWAMPAAGISGGLAYQGLSVEQGRKAQPIIGITDQPVTNIASLKIGDKTIVAGTPKFKPEAVPEIFKSRFMSDSGYREFLHPTEFNIAMKNILPTYDAATQELLKSTIAKRQMTYGVKSTHQLRDVPLEDVFTRHELGMATQKNLRTYMQQQKDFILWGSTANKAQVMGKGGVGYFREIHDIDIHVRNPAQTTKELLAVISKTEKPGKVTMKDGGLATSKGHLFDIKNIEGGMLEEIGVSTSELPQKGNVFLFPDEKTVKIGKFTTQSLSSQATAKLSSIGLREKTVSAAPWRAGKDPFDHVFINEPSLTKDLAKSYNPFKRMKAGKAERLDAKIQKLTEEKIEKQMIGKLPGQITIKQKEMFFDNLRAMRAGQSVLATPESELLYVSPPRSQPKLPMPGNLMRASGISAPASPPHIRHDQGSISSQIHQVISSQQRMFSPPRLSGSGRPGMGSGRSGMGSGRSGISTVRIPGYYAGVPSRSGISPPSGSGRIPVYPPGTVSPRSSIDYPRISPPPSPPVYPGGSVDYSPVYPRGSVDYPTIYPPKPPVIPRDQFDPPKFKFPKFDVMGRVRKTKGRKAAAYEITNPFSGMRELVGDIGFPTSRKGKKNWWEKL